MQEKITQTCPKCKGVGEVPLSRELQEVYDYLRRRKQATAYMVAEAIDRESRFSDTAFHTRLRLLEEAGLVTRRRSGKTWFYSIAKSTK